MAGGRPLKFKTVEELQEKIDGYFKTCEEKDIPLTVTGLAIALDTTRELLVDYGKRDEFSDAIRRCKLKIHNAYEIGLIKRGNSGDIFALKNFGWKDKQEVDHTSKGEQISGFNMVAPQEIEAEQGKTDE